MQTAARSMISSRELDAVLVLWQGFESAIGQGGLGKADALFRFGPSRLRQSPGRLEDAIG